MAKLISKVRLTAFAIAALFLVGQLAAIALNGEQFNRRLGLGMNLGNALEAPKEGQWGLTIKPEYLKTIKSAGFSHVRIPICWSAHAKAEAPYTIDPEFFDRVDEVVRIALSNNLFVIINMHHYGEFEKDPAKNKERFLAIWTQISQHYQKVSPNVAFEIYNEPCKMLIDAVWNQMLTEALAIIRKTNPDRCVIIGPVDWNNIYSLGSLQLPKNDVNLIATVHYYEPFPFTHQGASWVGPESAHWVGTKWTGDWKEIARLGTNFDIAKQWSKTNSRPIYVGEFGAFSKADMDSRVKWTKAVSGECAKRGFSAAYWEFGSGFGAYDTQSNSWRQPLLKALMDGWNLWHH